MQARLAKLAKGESVDYAELDGIVGGSIRARWGLLATARKNLLRDNGIVTVADGRAHVVTRVTDPGAVKAGRHHVDKARRQAARAIRKASAAETRHLTDAERLDRDVTVAVASTVAVFTAPRRLRGMSMADTDRLVKDAATRTQEATSRALGVAFATGSKGKGK